MATTRPTFIDLTPSESKADDSTPQSKQTLAPPRIQHFDGDVPPSLSPLDAFAAHSRRLARELEEIRLAGEKRMSRLPPNIVKQSLSEHQNSRPTVFRALSSTTEAIPPKPRTRKEVGRAGLSPEIAQPKDRPISSHPCISGSRKFNHEDEEEAFYTPLERSLILETPQSSIQKDYFGPTRCDSPPPIEGIRIVNASPPEKDKAETRVQSPEPQYLSPTSPLELTFDLAPPNAAFARKQGRTESSDDDYASSNAGSTFSRTRKLSSSSGISIPQSPTSPFMKQHDRSPSNQSLASLAENKQRRSIMNFSRPMSSSGFGSMVLGSPNRTETDGSRRSRASSSLSKEPASMTSLEDMSAPNSENVSNQTAASTLPRGRMADRTSLAFLGLSAPHCVNQESTSQDTPAKESERPKATIRSHKSNPSTSFTFNFSNVSTVELKDFTSMLSAKTDSKPSTPLESPEATPSTGNPIGLTAPPIPASSFEERSRSEQSESTIRPHTARSVSDYQALSPDEHVSKAIELHEHGDLKESTYHLRIAARQDHATGMVLYALACRHGWGMRPNPKEGVQWLRKAVDCAMSEVADDEDSASSKPKADFHEKKAHRAQFALSIYELGVSHLNGWGTEQDKALALRCFEVAGNWGDTDALTEAGFCYAEGIGCKKDLKKAAKLYRMAEARGVSMIGNSWIHKDKYNEANIDEKKSKTAKKMSQDKSQNKSKSRGFFGRKKSAPTITAT